MGKNTQQKAGNALLREFSSGGIVFRKDNGRVLWLVTASSPSKLYPEIRWRLPKGRIDDVGDDKPGPMASGEKRADEKSLENAAIREVGEEGGVKAKIVRKIESQRFFFNAKDRGRVLKFVTYYLMEWESDLKEGFGAETSEVKWLPYKDAYAKLSYGGERKILSKAKEILTSIGSKKED